MDADQKRTLSMTARDVFSPNAPIDKYSLFAGRTKEVKDIIGAYLQRGQHVIMFGERGVGKTSLANVLSEVFANANLQGTVSAKVNADASDDFSTLWRKVFREIPITQKMREMGYVAEGTTIRRTLDQFVPDKLVPDDIRHFLGSLESSIIIIDEIDRIKNPGVASLLADTIKTLSDHSVDCTLILVGVADTVDGLIAEHQSIERALLQIRMPRMSSGELTEVLDKGLGQLKMTIDAAARSRITELSQGLPHFTHLLGLHSVLVAIEDSRLNITTTDVEKAIHTAVENAHESILNAYHIAVSSARKTLYDQVLLACALAKTDIMGYFAANDVRTPMSSIMCKPYEIPAFSRHLNDFCEPRRGPILQKKGVSRSFRFRFVNPLLQPFVIMHGLDKGLIKDIVST